MYCKSFITFVACFTLLYQLQGQIRYDENAQKLGTQFRISFYCADTSQAKALVQGAWRLIDSLNLIFSDYEEGSEITLLSTTAGHGQWVEVSQPLWDVLIWSLQISEMSQGAFDVSIGPLSKLWRRAFRRNVMPTKEDIEAAQALVNYRWIHMREKDRTVLLQKSGMRLDLGGIAKGYIIDRVYNYFSQRGIYEVVVDGGGDLYVGAHPADQEWKISYGTHQPTIASEKTAVASSGDTFRYIESKGKRYSHIIDPRSGYGVDLPSEVVIQAPSAVLADAWASAVSVMGIQAFNARSDLSPEIKLLYWAHSKEIN